MEDAYNVWVISNQEKAEILKEHFVPDLQHFYEKLQNSSNWVSVLSASDKYDNFLYIPKSGLVKVSYFEKGGLGSMHFSAVEELTLKEMMDDLEFMDVKRTCIYKGLNRIYTETSF